MWRYWALEEGTLGVDPELQKTNDGKMPPVIHVDTDAPLFYGYPPFFEQGKSAVAHHAGQDRAAQRGSHYFAIDFEEDVHGAYFFHVAMLVSVQPQNLIKSLFLTF